jgi:hypothetical protein
MNYFGYRHGILHILFSLEMERIPLKPSAGEKAILQNNFLNADTEHQQRGYIGRIKTVFKKP